MITIATTPSDSADTKKLIAKWSSFEDQERAKLYQSETRQQNFLLVRAVLRALLESMHGHESWSINTDTQGKPYLLTSTGKAGPFISLSHTQGLVACAISQSEPIGIDIEHWRVRDFGAIANYAFTSPECEDVAYNGRQAFYRIWTLKEAMAKARGIGLLSSIHSAINVAGISEKKFFQTESWQLYYSVPQDNYSLAVATKNQAIWLETSINFVDNTNEIFKI